MNLGIYIYDRAEVLDFSGPFEVFSTASRICQEDNPPFEVFMVGETGGPVEARGGYRVLPHYGFSDHPAMDALIVVGGDHTGELEKPAVLEWVARQGRTVPLVASVCTGAFILAKAGVLHARRVTTHWEDLAALHEQFPRLEVVEDVRWVDEGNIVTSAGVAAGIDMSLHLVARLHSVALAERTARQMDFPWDKPEYEKY